MTPAEIDEEKKRAETLALAVGGTIAILLGLKTSDVTITWDRKRAWFVVDGRAVTLASVRREAVRFERSVAGRMIRLANDLQAGRIDLATWTEKMKQVIGSSHVIMAALASGSIAAAANNQHVQEKIESERRYAAGFAADIERKKLSTATIKARSVSYLLAASATFGAIGLAVHRLANYTEARRTTTARESCEDCRELDGRWMPIDDMPAIGALRCANRCRCYIEYR